MDEMFTLYQVVFRKKQQRIQGCLRQVPLPKPERAAHFCQYSHGHVATNCDYCQVERVSRIMCTGVWRMRERCDRTAGGGGARAVFHRKIMLELRERTGLSQAKRVRVERVRQAEKATYKGLDTRERRKAQDSEGKRPQETVERQVGDGQTAPEPTGGHGEDLSPAGGAERGHGRG